MTIAEFLRARYDEEAAPALRIPEGQRVWTVDGGSICAGHPTDLVVDWVYDDHAEHIARFDPARVLREVEAKRRIVDIHQHEKATSYNTDHGFGCSVCDWDPDYGQGGDGWCATVRLLALPYADHSDYDPSWAPPNG